MTIMTIVTCCRAGMPEAGSSDNDRLLSYRAMLNYNSQDNDFFTTRGSRFEAEYAIYTDNMYQYDGHTPFGILSARWRTALRLTDRFSLRPMVYGRALMGRGIPYVMGNFIGGPFSDIISSIRCLLRVSATWSGLPMCSSDWNVLLSSV